MAQQESGGSLAGIVTTEDGGPLAGAGVTVARNERFDPRTGAVLSPIVHRSAVVGPDGRYAISDLPDGFYRICVRAEGYLDTCRWRVGGADSFTLGPEARGAVRDFVLRKGEADRDRRRRSRRPRHRAWAGSARGQLEAWRADRGGLGAPGLPETVRRPL